MAEHAKSDWRKADLSEAERAMLEVVEKLTIAPSSMRQSDVDQLREVGWTDRDILDIVQVCAYFNFRVRVVDGLGLDSNEAQVKSARTSRERAAALAGERGVELPEDIWGLAEQQEWAGTR